MAKSREDLQVLLEEILGSRNVYYQPPESIKLKYPCIIYEKSDVFTDYANNSHYRDTKLYSVMLIYKDPDWELPDEFGKLSYCRFDRHYVTDNLNHDVFSLYY